MNSANKNTSVLSISSNKIHDCKDVLKYLYKSGITCSITKTNNIVQYGDELRYEKGCRILFNSHKPNMINKQFWNQLKHRYDLQCAYLNVNGKFKGCINDYLNQSKCTSFQK